MAKHAGINSEVLLERWGCAHAPAHWMFRFYNHLLVITPFFTHGNVLALVQRSAAKPLLFFASPYNNFLSTFYQHYGTMATFLESQSVRSLEKNQILLLHQS